MNYATGAFIRFTLTQDRGKFLLGKTSDDKVLLVDEQAVGAAKTYTLGTYDYQGDGSINFFSTLQGSTLSPGDGLLGGLMVGNPGTLYTYGSQPAAGGTQQVWVAKWDYTGKNFWIVNPSGKLEPSFFSLQESTSRHLSFTGKRSPDTTWVAGSMETSHGAQEWMDTVTKKMRVRYVVENPTTEWKYAFDSLGFSKFDLTGKVRLMNTMHEFKDDTIYTRPVVIATSWLFMAMQRGDEITLLSTGDLTSAWSEAYWEKPPVRLILLSTVDGDVLVVSGNGFITKYKRN